MLGSSGWFCLNLEESRPWECLPDLELKFSRGAPRCSGRGPKESFTCRGHGESHGHPFTQTLTVDFLQFSPTSKSGDHNLYAENSKREKCKVFYCGSCWNFYLQGSSLGITSNMQEQHKKKRNKIGR